MDALCINQLDDDEKGHQVQMMKKIYETAEMVIVWLGMGTKHTDEAMRMLNLRNEDPKQCLTDADLADKEALGLYYLYSGATYWKRVWILQEFVVARDYVVLCNRALATKEAFERLPRVCQDYSTGSVLWFVFSGCPVVTMVALRDSRYSVSRPPVILDNWLDVLWRKGFRATDSRDYIFAILGISDDGDSIVVDYKLSQWEVFCAALSITTGNGEIPLRGRISNTIRVAELMGIPSDLAWKFLHETLKR